MNNQLIHEWVMGECWHESVMIEPDGRTAEVDAVRHVCRCGAFSPCDGYGLSDFKRIDYSNPTNHEALSSKFREWGEWQHFGEHLSDLLLLGALDKPFDMFCWWHEHDNQGKLFYLADYIRSKGEEYWNGKRGTHE